MTDELAAAQAELARAKAELDWHVRRITMQAASSLFRYPHQVRVTRRDLGLLPEPAPTTDDGVYVITTVE